MSRTNVQSFSEGSQESILALIQAIAPEVANTSGGHLSSDEVANRLTNKLAELVGQENVGGERRNERGESINEEGLPIVDISEHVDPTDLRSSTSKPTPVSVEPLIPLAGLSDEARVRLRSKRNQILDLLEKEETEGHFSQRRRQAKDQELDMQKRREETDRWKDARDLQKKMGRALLQNFSRAKEKERQEQAVQRVKDEEADLDRRRSPTKRKTVAFAEQTEQIDRSETESESIDSEWGDVTPGRLTRRRRPNLASQALLDQHPLKMNVVERKPDPPKGRVDSDDDSEPDVLSDSSEAEEEEEEPVLEADEVDFDGAQHHREIALEYYSKRNTIGTAATEVMMGHSHEIDRPSGVTQTPKPAFSQFKANRLASAYNASTTSPSHSQSTSLGESVLPTSSARKIQHSIRTGKLDADGNLVGGEDGSDSEKETEGLQEMLELFRNGEIYNIGPNHEYIHTIPPASQMHVASPSISHTVSLPPPSARSKILPKFKASGPYGGRRITTPVSISTSGPGSPSSEPLSSSTTPISSESRSSPKLDTVITPTFGEKDPHPHPTKFPNVPQMQLPRPNSVPSGSPFPMITESPSFPVPSRFQSTSVEVADSSSLQQAGSTRPDRPPMVLSTRNLEREPSARWNKQEASFQVPTPRDQPVSVVLSAVQESTTGRMSGQTGGVQEQNKISPFKAELLS